MKKWLSLSTLILTSSLFAEEMCFNLSKDGQQWSRTPELICVSDPLLPNTREKTITLKTSDLLTEDIFAVFYLDSIHTKSHEKKLQVESGIKNPSNSIFNKLSIVFEGDKTETGDVFPLKGKVQIGENIFYYQEAGY